ncbi:SCO6880 family protein [Streptomyces sp. NPDC096095]|uniref:SCO6880 family protein n=1 Tax=Streptomyces sp. NPDC096095 TaxID=3155545 RepID=UPI00331A627A
MSNKHQAEATTASVKFPHRSRRGILLGLTASQLIVVSLTGLLLLAVILTRGVVGALELIPLWAAIALLVFVRHRGRALADWAPIVTRYVLRRMRGQLIWLTRPSRRPIREGLLHLPGTVASLRVVTRVEAHLDAITAALPRAGTHERALTIAAGETAALAGWVAWDLGEHDKATSYYGVTSECAKKAGHPPLRALALGYASYGAPSPAKALEMLSQAAQDVRGRGNATAAAWALGRYAEEAAQSGDDAAALRALDQARFAYDFADHTSEQAWVRFVTPYRMDSLTLSVYGELKRQELTATADSAVERLGGELPDSGVVVLGDLASALLRGGDVDRGAYVAHQFAAAAESKPNTMGRQRAQAIAAGLPDTEHDLASHLLTFAML